MAGKPHCSIHPSMRGIVLLVLFTLLGLAGGTGELRYALLIRVANYAYFVILDVHHLEVSVPRLLASSMTMMMIVPSVMIIMIILIPPQQALQTSLSHG